MIPKPDASSGLGIKWPSKKIETDELDTLLAEIRTRL